LIGRQQAFDLRQNAHSVNGGQRMGELTLDGHCNFVVAE
jgi:hypothetical protein